MFYLLKFFTFGIIFSILLISNLSSYQEISNILQISDKNSCESMEGVWDNSKCTVSHLLIKSEETFRVSSGIELIINGTFENFGTLELNYNSTLINESNSIIKNKVGGVISNHQGTFINKLGGTIDNNEGTIFNNLHSFISNEGLIRNNGNISNKGQIENKGDGSVNQCVIGCVFEKSFIPIGLIINEKNGNIINSGGRITNSNGGHIFNNNTASISNKDGSLIINKLGGIITNNLEGTFTNEKSIIFNDASSINNGRKGSIYNLELGIIFNTKGSFLNNNFNGHIVNKGVIFNDGGNVNTNNGSIDNQNKIYNDCGGLIINHEVISDPVIDIHCSLFLQGIKIEEKNEN